MPNQALLFPIGTLVYPERAGFILSFAIMVQRHKTPRLFGAPANFQVSADETPGRN
jgi:hypothetical protein